MKLVHTTQRVSIAPILQEGLRCSKETGVKTFSCYNGNYIYFEAIPNSYPMESLWPYGNYHFILDNNWLDAHTNQFKVHSVGPLKEDEVRMKEFRLFLKNYGIKTLGKSCACTPATQFQIVSLQSIPIEALEKLVIECKPTDPLANKIKSILPTHIDLSVVEPRQLYII